MCTVLLMRLCKICAAFITGLLNNIGTHVDPIILIQKIREGLEIPGLRNSLVQILHDYYLQVEFCCYISLCFVFHVIFSLSICGNTFAFMLFMELLDRMYQLIVILNINTIPALTLVNSSSCKNNITFIRNINL